MAVAGVMLFSCREGGVTPSAPRILLDNESGIYTTKAGRQITVSPEYENAEGAVFSWVLESGEELSSAPVLEFVSDETGRFYVSLTVSTDGGMDKADIRIDVLDLTPPEITLPGAEDGFEILHRWRLHTDGVLAGRRCLRSQCWYLKERNWGIMRSGWRQPMRMAAMQWTLPLV